jgi:uncharacterized integral membrane protein (TIGR00697 family)
MNNKLLPAMNSYGHIKLSKYLVFLAMTYMVVTAVPAMLLYRLISIGYLTLPGGMFIFPMIYILTDVIAEVYGYQVARLFIWASLINNFLIAILIMTVIYLPFPNDLKVISHEYVDVYHGLLRADIANIAGVLISRFVNAYVIAKWKILVRGKWFILRSFCANILGDILMLLVWAPVAFAGVVNTEKLISITLSDFLVRAIYALIGSIPALLLVIYLKNKEKVDIYDVSTNFNPFKLSCQGE